MAFIHGNEVGEIFAANAFEVKSPAAMMMEEKEKEEEKEILARMLDSLSCN